MSKALYRKYRSKSLKEVIGQKHITDILTRAIESNRVSHAYLLTGPRGVGKTSVARILAHEINKLEYNDSKTHLDIIEIDAASNTGVDDIRDLREKAQIAPVSAKKKVYIIDEVHMLSKGAFNALLKTLEEPPEHVVFILATTNVEKLPATIISRTQQFSFRPINIADAVRHLSYIANQEGIKIDDEALTLIAEHSDGSFRDSISLLDQLSNLVGNDKSVSSKLIEEAIGLTPKETINQIIASVETKDLKTVVDLVNNAINSGSNPILLASLLANNICKNLTDKPQLVQLMDSLIDVAKSPNPHLKLLSVLGKSSSQKSYSKSIALQAPVHEITATIDDLEKQAIKDTTIGNSPKEPKTTNLKQHKGAQAQKKIAKKDSDFSLDTSSFDWSKLIDYAKSNHVALYSVLSKCGYEIAGDSLNLYTNSKFYKNKLDDVRYSPLISKCLQAIGVTGLNINTIPTAIPSKDSTIAAVAAIMGGGEEIKVEF